MAQAKTHLTVLRRFRDNLRNLVELPQPSPEEVADILGEIRHIERLMADWRRSLSAETPDAEGKNYRTVTKRRARRSYNTTRIIGDVQVALAKERGEASAWDAIRELMGADALRLQVRWSDLKKLLALWDIPLVVAQHEIEDGDLAEAQVGEIWEEYTTQEAITND